MKKLSLIASSVTLVLVLNSCGPTFNSIPIRNTYLTTPFTTYSDQSMEKVWSNIIELYATNGLSIKLVDKSSGLIISEQVSFMDDYAVEGPGGKLSNPDAYVVLEKKTGGFGLPIAPQKVLGQWNIRVKETENNKVLINVNLTNLKGEFYSPGGRYDAPVSLAFRGVSTGNFEEIIAQAIK
jgi:hypothetical protein